MPKDVRFNIKLSIDGKESLVTASTNVKELASGLGLIRESQGQVPLIRYIQMNQTYLSL